MAAGGTRTSDLRIMRRIGARGSSPQPTRDFILIVELPVLAYALARCIGFDGS